MPAWLVTLIVTVLQKTGLVNAAEALIVKGITNAEEHIKNLKTYQEYPTGKNGQ